MTNEKSVYVLIQSHDWGGDVAEDDYEAEFPFKIHEVFSNQVTGYCGGGEHSAVNKIATSPKHLMELVGRPSGYQHCRLEVVGRSLEG
jgi:hypothetical protein